ncbi:tRNA uridine-5-carboxymethylaminomethyl(34) synthesis enzyme MnmG [Desulfuribacillus alkaliarsenatis]|uniref:tRNA uridine 5-carboxymethylaminomethyl modification enzyme MnmG n=1 Tax=Desulfuribacillus alkaliarsenatis TaxID=766136 RepID=A0A1E5G2N0_9FIRM|nr:tRNA uridine-5-carboxymethylaminomethyl(34) synthesis enzyme MnmG [Desulfuribacillus alkaliarsenatis]OEF97318.1 tRNA uridine-5-carboxymethylaminomethyl(34) synthesis enzyme MnmG [Desulfuribacillus alkaliarsenatis]
MQYKAGTFDIIVVGGGHAGCEAALASARMGLKTLIITISFDDVAHMPCNPSIGGPAKGHVVREIDALGGEMANNIDRANIQVRMLNTGKGPAVHALRAQADRHLYSASMKQVLESTSNLTVRQGLVEKLIVNNAKVEGVELQTGAQFYAKAVVVTTGTYLRSKIIIGDVNFNSGPNGMLASMKLSENMKEHGIEFVRYKTGTPPRVNKNSIDFSKMTIQPGDEEFLSFSHALCDYNRPRFDCWLTYTTEKTKDIIMNNLDRSPMYSGAIEGTGTRYCPSIEDKMVRFNDKPTHQIFIEPEGENTIEYYVQGFSTSFPEDLQIEMLRSISGLENVEMIRPGYAIEYDAVISTQLHPTLEHKHMQGLFTAGQVNGTSGYEEAAGQGIIAGINAALKVLDKEPMILKRSDAYIGVMIDDLVTKGTMDPYRLLTSRAEYRLLLRNDNADLRLTEIGYGVGLVSEEAYQRFTSKKQMIELELERLGQYKLRPNQETNDKIVQLGSVPIVNLTSLKDLLKRPEIEYKHIQQLAPTETQLPKEVIEQVVIQTKYEGYIKKQLEQVEKNKKLENQLIPEGVDYLKIPGIALEAREKLNKIQPRSVGQAARISGVNPADISILLIYLEQLKRGGNANNGQSQ